MNFLLQYSSFILFSALYIVTPLSTQFGYHLGLFYPVLATLLLPTPIHSVGGTLDD